MSLHGDPRALPAPSSTCRCAGGCRLHTRNGPSPDTTQAGPDLTLPASRLWERNVYEPLAVVCPLPRPRRTEAGRRESWPVALEPHPGPYTVFVLNSHCRGGFRKLELKIDFNVAPKTIHTSRDLSRANKNPFWKIPHSPQVSKNFRKVPRKTALSVKTMKMSPKTQENKAQDQELADAAEADPGSFRESNIGPRR